MIPSLLEQLTAAKVPTARAVALLDRTEQHLAELVEWLEGRNATTQMAAAAFNAHEGTMRARLKLLVAQRRAISWSVNRTLWFSLSQAELTRRRRAR